MGEFFAFSTNPSNFELYARARVHLANFLSSRRELLESHEDIILTLVITQAKIQFIQTKAGKFYK